MFTEESHTPPPKPFDGQEGGVILFTNVFPTTEKLQRCVNNRGRQINGMEASLCGAVYSAPPNLCGYLFTPPTSDSCIQDF